LNNYNNTNNNTKFKLVDYTLRPSFSSPGAMMQPVVQLEDARALDTFSSVRDLFRIQGMASVGFVLI
jgi:hypothetical protein